MEIERLLVEGWSVIQIAKRFGVHRQSIYEQIWRRRRLYAKMVSEYMARAR